MAVLGLVLLAGAAVFTVSAVSSNTGATEVHLWGLSVSNLSVGLVFVVGLITTAVGLAGLLMTLAGVRRGARLRRQRHLLVRENRRLSRELGHAPDAVSAEPSGQATPAGGGRSTVQSAEGQREQHQPTA